MVVAGGALTGISLLTNTLVDKLLPSNDGSNFGEETLNNPTIEHEEKNNRSATFLFDFENGSTSLIIIIICGIVTLLLAMGVASPSAAAPDLAPDFVVENLTPQEEKSSIENNGMHINPMYSALIPH